MTAPLTAWLVHPMTLALASLAIAAMLFVLELLLATLARLGNVRFQGILEDHQGVLTWVADRRIHLSRVTDILRWIEIACLGLLWLAIGRLPWPQWWHFVLAAAIAAGVIILLTRTVAGSINEDGVARLLRMVSPVAAPLIRAVIRNGHTEPPQLPLEDDEEEASEREIQAFLEAGQAAGIFEGEEGEFVESLVDFFDTVVREVMTPRTEMVTVPDTASFDELLKTFADTLKSRVPIYHETVDKIIGVAHVKVCVQHAIAGSRPPVTELVNPCLVVPGTKELGELLKDFQQNHQQMAIVVDEYGGTSGLVTLEDILEEIVGEIEDEHDRMQPPEWQELEPGVYRMQGRAPLEALGELFSVVVKEEDVDTVGGLVFSRHGTVPEAGTRVEEPAYGLAFTVDEMDERRIVSVTVQRFEPQAALPGGAAP
ncbi:MAG TPA: hemolysin family protein [Methylomirabilota bacterium]|nr:hemolysin family protein [Methylomirabilota bacterium]